MRILAINITTEAFSVALLEKGKYFSHLKKRYQDNAQYILLMIKKILFQRNISLTDLDALAFSRGPDSFTNVRLSAAIIQGLALGANLSTIGVSTLAIMAQSAFRQTRATRVLVAIDAGIGEIYWAEYTRDRNGFWVGEKTEGLYQLEKICTRITTLSGRWAIVGSGWKVLIAFLQKKNLLLFNNSILSSTAEDILPIAFYLLKAGRILAPEDIKPVYLRNKVAKKPISKKIKSLHLHKRELKITMQKL